MGRMLVTGGTGTLGSHVVPLLVAAGQDVRVLSRRAGATVPDDGVELMAGDLATGEGIAAALAGVDVVLHLAGNRPGTTRPPRRSSTPPARPGRRTWSTSPWSAQERYP